MHPWHDVDPRQKNEGEVLALIEIPQGSRAKYEVHKASGLLMLDRMLAASMVFPINYGFIPQTLAEDGDPLDITVMSLLPLEPLCLVKARIVGSFTMIDRGQADDKLLAVAIEDPTVNHIRTLEDWPEHLLKEMAHFFARYKEIEGKPVTVHDPKGRGDALRQLEESFLRYMEEKF
jgi:inorganic pyrophosphatase